MDKLTYRTYDPERDKTSIHRLWKEIGWVDGDEFDALDIGLSGSRAIVVDLNGSAECLAESFDADLDYLGERLSLAAITAITVSHIARKQHIALRMTAKRLAIDAEDGYAMSALGIFDQGFYNKVGFGNGSYDHYYQFSPASLRVESTSRIPVRLTADDGEIINANRLRRLRRHGSVSFKVPHHTQSAMASDKSCFGLGFENERGELTHHIWLFGMGKEHGPYHLYWMAYESWEGFLELMGLVKSLADQIYAVKMLEPSGIHLQDFLERPFYHRDLTDKSPNENYCRANSYYQWRMLDLHQCLAKTHLPGGGLKFNLRLNDPVVKYLEPDEPWQGVGGEYVVTLGEESSAKPGVDKSLETLECSVNAFTRLWLGNLSATGLRLSEDFKATDALVNKLDQFIRLPKPQPDWMF